MPPWRRRKFDDDDGRDAVEDEEMLLPHNPFCDQNMIGSNLLEAQPLYYVDD
ncbi:hypothetical protein Fmac_031530 [Flemingia macrophylla]|uniref:Uncharacterized protein n=1 Tax=Flemingia macrophylla TaxID=520843 RepID=A0ABD1L2B4_9FABA